MSQHCLLRHWSQPNNIVILMSHQFQTATYNFPRLLVQLSDSDILRMKTQIYNTHCNTQMLNHFHPHMLHTMDTLYIPPMTMLPFHNTRTHIDTNMLLLYMMNWYMGMFYVFWTVYHNCLHCPSCWMIHMYTLYIQHIYGSGIHSRFHIQHHYHMRMYMLLFALSGHLYMYMLGDNNT